ncbi:MAG: twin-arginine translocase subunit TatC, partial [Bryobacteraceae bacterium]
TGGLFLCGGVFAYFVAFRYTLVFLFGIGEDVNVTSLISIDDYFTNFVNVMLGISVTFELPVLIFFLTLLRVASPSFLLRHSDYAILAILILTALVTPSQDAFTLTLFAVPMLLLYFLGVFASYLLVLRREGRKFPWKLFFVWLAAALIVAGIAMGYTGYWRALIK